LNRFVLPAILAAALLARAAPADQGQLDASPSLFTVMAAINAAGYNADLSSPNNNPLRNRIRAELAKRNIPSLDAIKEFVAQHHKVNATEELSQYLSFALTASGPPDFEIKMRDVDIPPDVTPLRDFSQLMAAFYKEAGIADLWQSAQPDIDKMIGPYHGPVMDAVLQVNAYLRQQTSGFKGRHFQIFVEPLGPPNQVQSRSYGNEYTIVVTPSPEPHVFEIRQAYLYYLLDPLATRNEEILNRKKTLADHVARAHALSDAYKHDFLLLTTSSLVRAVEARLDHKPESVQQSLKEGYILAPYFYEALQAYEKQEQSMILYYTSMVQAIDLVREDRRLVPVDFDSEPTPAPVHKTETVVTEVPLVYDTLSKAEQFLKQKEFDRAEKLYQEVLQQTDKKPLLAAGNYGLAQIALAQDDAEEAEQLLEKTLTLEPEAPMKAWALVYLGKLRLEVGDREQAAQHFQEALKVEGASDLARQEAQKGLQEIAKKEN